jgi:YebC/PmpR family DNA-binding regulatory protein
MSGHSKWATIRRKKGALDAKRGKIFTQLIREIAMAAKLGGGDPDSNPRLRLAMDKARGNNMPKDNIERAIRRGTGEGDEAEYEEIRYEGYGPGGVAVIVDTLTDNRTRTVAEVRHAFSKHGGNMGTSGSVAFMFEKKGILSFERAGIDADVLIEAAMEADALDIVEEDETITVQTAPERFFEIKTALEQKGFKPETAETQMIPTSTISISGREAETMLKLMEVLDEHDDVQHVFANFDISEEAMAEAAKAG